MDIVHWTTAKFKADRPISDRPIFEKNKFINFGALLIVPTPNVEVKESGSE